MKVLLIPMRAKEELESLVKFASQRENHFRPAQGFIPGDHAPYVRKFTAIDSEAGRVDLRVVFTITHANDDSLWRHASISLRERSNAPDPAAVCMVCKLLGFTGGMEDWEIVRHPNETNVIVVVQALTSAVGGFTCPRCTRTSHNPNDLREGYCGACHDWTEVRQ